MWDTKHILATIVGPGVLLAAGVGLMIWPTYRKAQELRDEVTTLEQKVLGLDGATTHVENLAADLQTVKRQIDGNLKVIPEQADIASIIRKLSLPVDGNTVIDQTFTTGSSNPAIPDDPKSTVETTPLTVDMEANFDSVFALVRAAESMDRLIRVASLRLECNREKEQRDFDGKPVLRASVGLEAVYHKSEAGAP